MNSIWTQTTTHPKFKALNGNTKTDVLIVGGGITGILCAYTLNQAGVDYMLLEADQICGGITKNTTAKITVQHSLIYDKLIRSVGANTARLYLEANLKALNEYKEICKTIDCDFKLRDSYVYSLRSSGKIEREVKAFEKLGFSAEFTNNTELPFAVAGAVKIKDQAQFNPLKFLFGISKDLNIFENTKVLEFTPDGVVTNRGKVTAKKTIVTTHFPIINKHGSYFLKLYQHRSYVLALENAQNIQGMYVDEDMKGLSFRGYNDLLLLGGGSHRTGKKGGGWKELEEFANHYYKSAKIVNRFATQDCMSLDSVAYIGNYSKNTPNLYVATGFNKWGMTTAMAAASILRDMITGKQNPYKKVFSPSRTILKPQLAVNTAESIIGILTPTVPRCSHLGCALKYNEQEHSWDCSCHGSRFTLDGRLIDNPATDDKHK